MSDLFDTLTEDPKKKKKDLFDDLTAAPNGGDVFDQIEPAAPAAGGDIFDHVAAPIENLPRGTTEPEENGPNLVEAALGLVRKGKDLATATITDKPNTAPEKAYDPNASAVDRFLIAKPEEAAQTIRQNLGLAQSLARQGTGEPLTPEQAKFAQEQESPPTEQDIVQKAQSTGNVPYADIAKNILAGEVGAQLPLTPSEIAAYILGGKAIHEGGAALAEAVPALAKPISQLGGALGDWIKERVLTKGVEVPFTADDARAFYTFAKGAMDPETYDLLLKMPKERVVDMAKRAMAGESVSFEKRVPRFGKGFSEVAPQAPSVPEGAPSAPGQNPIATTGEPPAAAAPAPEPPAPAAAPPSIRIDENSISPQGVAYINERFPTLGKAITGKNMTLNQEQLHDVLLKASTAGEEALLRGAAPEEADQIASRTFAQEVQPHLEKNVPPPKPAPKLDVFDEAIAKQRIQEMQDLPPHELEPKEYAQIHGQGRPKTEVMREHKSLVNEALASNQAVPAKVLEHYPEHIASTVDLGNGEKAHITHQQIKSEAENLYVQALEERQGLIHPLEDFVKQEGGLAPYKPSEFTGKKEEGEEYKSVPVRLRGDVPYDEMVSRAKDAGLLPRDAAYGELYSVLGGLPERGAIPKREEFYPEAQRNLEHEAVQNAGPEVPEQTQQFYSAQKQADSLRRAREAAGIVEKIADANKISDRVMVRILDSIAIDPVAFAKEYPGKNPADYQAFGRTQTTISPKEGTQAFVDFVAGADNMDGAHEALHMAEELLLDEKEKAILGEKFGDVHDRADAFARFYNQGEQPEDPFLKKIFDRIKAFLEKVKNWIQKNKFTTADEIFAKVKEGGFAGRGGLSETAATNYKAAFHGTPHEFDRFDLSKIGTGEGQQAYGHGLYFADKKEVAEFYRNSLSGKNQMVPVAVQNALRELHFDVGNGGAEDAIARIEKSADWKKQFRLSEAETSSAAVKEIDDFVQRHKKSGRLYQVDIPEDHELLNHDIILADHSKALRAKLEKINKDLNLKLDPYEATGETLYDAIAEDASQAKMGLRSGLEDFVKKTPGAIRMSNDELASRYLASQGIPGLKYLDQFSRGAAVGSHNYVIFDDSRVKITDRYSAKKKIDQTKTPEFQKWFGESKVVDEDGQPLVMYHGTKEKFTSFDINTIRNGGPFGNGFYFSNDKDLGTRYSDGGEPVATYVALKNPLIIDYDAKTPNPERSIFRNNRSAEVTRILKGKGYDGVLIKQLSDNGYVEAIAFNPSQIKSATGNRGTFDSQNPDIRYSARPKEENAPTFYSQLQRTLETKLPARAMPDQIENILNSQDVKKDEVDWSGIKEWLAERKGKGSIPKQDVLDFLKQNEVKIQEVTKGAQKNQLVNWEQWGDGAFAANGNRIANIEKATAYPSGAPVYTIRFKPDVPGIWDFPSLDAAKREAERQLEMTPADRTKFDKYQLPGGENYREMLLTLPPPDTTQGEGFGALNRRIIDRLGRSNFAMSELTPEELAENQRLKNLKDPEPQAPFKSSHFSEPNVLAHVRFNERTDAEGKKVLFVEEVQSDWHQKGRDRGYKSEIPPVPKMNDFTVEQTPDQYIVHAPGMEPLAVGKGTVSSEYNAKSYASQYWGKLKTEAERNQSFRESVPDAPFKKSWHELVMKRMLRYAAENGFDKVAWTTGEQQAERYDLSKQIDDISYKANGDGTYDISAWKGSDEIIEQTDRSIEQVADLVGKDMAEKIKAGIGEPNKNDVGETFNVLSGLDLKVGGEGMKGFYDQILPSFLNKYTKKWGGRVGQSKLDVGNDMEAIPEYAGPEYSIEELEKKAGSLRLNSALSQQVTNIIRMIRAGSTFKRAIEHDGSIALAEQLGGSFSKTPRLTQNVHSLDITPEMRDSVLQKGQPLYSARKKPIEGQAGASKKDDENTAPFTVEDAKIAVAKEGGYNLVHESTGDLFDQKENEIAPQNAVPAKAGGQPSFKPPVRLPGALLDTPFAVQFKKTGSLLIPNQKISGPADLAFAFRFLHDETQENFFLGAVKNGRIVAIEHLGIGTIDQVAAYPYETLNLLSQKDADSYFVVHNHPSGYVMPSEEDKRLTSALNRMLSESGRKLLGHVIINGGKFGFIDANLNVAEFEHKDYKRLKKLPLLRKYTEWYTRKEDLMNGPILNSPSKVMELTKSLHADPEAVVAYLLNTQLHVLNAIVVPRDRLTAGYLQDLAASHRANGVVLVNSGLSDEAYTNAKRMLTYADIRLLDAIDFGPGANPFGYKSKVEKGLEPKISPYSSGESKTSYSAKENPPVPPPPEKPPAQGFNTPAGTASPSKWQKFLSEMYDRFQVIKYAKGKEIAPEFPKAGGNYTRSYVMARTLPGKIRGISESLLTELNDSLKPLKNHEDREILNRIYSLRNYADLDKIGKTTNNMTAAAATTEMDALKKKVGVERFDRIAKVADKLADIQNNKALKILVDANVISQQAADVLRDRYPNYLRSEILEEKLGETIPDFKKADNGEPIGKINRSFLKTKKGTKKAINEDVITVIRKSLVTKVAAAQKQITIDQIAKDFGTEVGSQLFQDGKIIRTVDPSKIPPGFVVSSVRASGGRVFAVSQEVSDLLDGLNQRQADFITRAMSAYNRFFRAGATTLRAPFVFNNIFRDVQEAVIKKRSIPGQRSQLTSYAEAAFRSLKETLGIPDHVFEAWKRAGGAYGGAVSSLMKDVEIPGRLGTTPEKIARALKTAVTLPMEAIANLAEFSENTSRLAEWLRVSTTNMPEELKALQSRDITVDFEKVGDAMKRINQLVPFLNANVQGSVNSARIMRDHPILALLRILTGIALPTVALYEYNKKFKNDGVIDPYIKNSYWYVNTGSEATIDGKRLPVLITIRKGELSQQVGYFVQSLLEYANRDPNFQQRADDFTLQGTIDNAVSSVVPPLVRVPIEEAANRNFFSGRPIVTQSIQDVSEEHQFKPGTTNTSRRIGEATGVSPARFEHMATGLFPASSQALEISDMLTRPDPMIKREEKRLFPLQSFVPMIRTPSGFFSQEEDAAQRFERGQKVEARTKNFLYENAYRQFAKHPTAKNEDLLNRLEEDLSGVDARRIRKKINKEEKLQELDADERALKKLPKKIRRAYEDQQQ
jgi:hypothetical protein